MGNLGRAGYGATLDGMVSLPFTDRVFAYPAAQWPYSYDSCDIGTLKNQTLNGLPLAATVNGDDTRGGVLSYLPGQRLSRCTCSGEDHPGPKHADGTFVGRAAPEIDIFEAEVLLAFLSFEPWGLLNCVPDLRNTACRRRFPVCTMGGELFVLAL